MSGCRKGWGRALALASFLCGPLLRAEPPQGARVLAPGEWVQAIAPVEEKGTRILEEERVLGYLDEGDWAAYGPFTFRGGFTDRMEIEFAAPGTRGQISVHLDTPDGPTVAEFKVIGTGGYDRFRVQQTALEQLPGTHLLVFVFDAYSTGNLRAFRVLTPEQPDSPNVLRYAEVQREIAATVDDRLAKLIADHEEPILRHRTETVVLRGRPGAPVRVRQLRHAFPFGTAVAGPFFDPDSKIPEDDRRRYLEVLRENFNSVTPENELKWRINEPVRGEVTFEAADRMLDWALAQGMEFRGHCVFWGREESLPAWQKDLDNAELLSSIRERARLAVSRYRGRIREWEVNNEMLHCLWYADRLGEEIHHRMFEWVRAEDPEARLCVNDFGVLTYDGGPERYIAHIRGFLDAGLPVGGIGVQGHFGEETRPEVIKKRLDRLAVLGLPIRVTEFDANTSNEDLAALTLATVYVSAFAHPAVEGLTMWGFWEGFHWRPNAALWKRDWSETRSARVFRDLVHRRWWTDVSGVIGPDGTLPVRVFFGDHHVEIDGHASRLVSRRGSSPRFLNSEPEPTPAQQP